MRGMTIPDLQSFKWLMDPNLSPDGSQILYTQTEIHQESRDYNSQIYLLSVEDGEIPRQITSGKNRNTTPRWSPCGSKVAFVSDRSGTNQIWLLPFSDGGEALQLTWMRHGANNPLWSPDGSRIAFVSRMFPSEEMESMFTPLSSQDKEAELQRKKEQGYVVDSLRYRFDGSGYADGSYNQIWVLHMQSKEIIRVTSGPWHHQDFSWSPCGEYLVVSANRREDADANPWDSDLWIVPSSGGDMRQITDTRGPCNSPEWSPDGRNIAYLGHLREYSGATISRLWVVSAEGGEPRCLSEDFDQGFSEAVGSDMTRTAGAGRGIAWYPCSTKILLSAGYQGTTQLYAIGLDKTVTPLSKGERYIYGWSLHREARNLVIAWGDDCVPNELSLLDLTDLTERQLTKSNIWLEDVSLSPSEVFWCKGYADSKLQGWLMKPINWQEGKQYPLILSIHGGPHNMYGFAFQHFFQVMTSAGYYVLYLNPRGGQSYGQEFQYGVISKYGEGDYQDLMLALDQVLLDHPDIDPSRLGVIGASYGGFMTNWIVGHTNRFRAAVSGVSISNWISFFGTSDIGYHFCENQHGVNPLQDWDELVRISPLTYVKDITTPLLLVSNELDYRCPIEQAEQLFVALKMLGRDVRMIRFPNHGHLLASSGYPPMRMNRLEHIMNWFADKI
ncbi:MAG: S9 family peptidase [Symbiobacteriaceae bacterium]|nr:S9 family peptidase [Symbiobacteriaceae bacterium]